MASKKVILATGASSGMGKDAALQLIKEGHTVYGAARRAEKMQDLVEAGGHALQMDLTDEGQIVAGVKQVVAEQDRIDVLINNAGYAVYGAIEDVPIEDARRQFEVNIFGLARITQEVLPHMRAQGSGKIINISSMGGKVYTPLGAWYHATKHALEGWSDCLRLELEPFNIDVVVIQPGIITTEFGDVMVQPMVDRSAGGPYEKMAQAVARATRDSYENGGSSPASVITALISKAIASPNPRTRYVAGKFAKPMLFLRRWLSDRMFDRVIMSQVK
ncbi:MAG: oxidoreductase [Phaeodactylibacter sp.]|nr:oxidoreductase [Phaeodactylibacter sp.]MCB9290932.1 oxidoreductase [Lewinellaceae bacterium]